MKFTIRFTAIAVVACAAFLTTSCASITNDANQQISFKAPGCKRGTVSCQAKNKRGSWTFVVPSVVAIRRSDDVLHVECENEHGESHIESITSRLGGKIVASAVFLDLGIVDSITDKHREYPEQIILQMCD